jgi:hypothetical protein
MEVPSIFQRIIIISFLLLILFGLCIHYNNNYVANEKYYTIDNEKYYTTATILSDYPEGENVCVSGYVTGVYKDGFYLKDEYPNQNLVYKVDSTSKVNLNDEVSVLGKLGPLYEIKSSQIFVFNDWKYNSILLRSMIAGISLLILFLIYWKFDFKTFEFVRLKENRASKSFRFAALKSKILTVFLNHKIFFKKILRKR